MEAVLAKLGPPLADWRVVPESESAGKPGTGNEIPRRGIQGFQKIAGAEFRSLSPFFRLVQ
jgi:hypothetical protein